MKTLIIYAHLLAACVAIGSLMLQDLALWRSRHRALTQEERGALRNTAKIAMTVLIILWVTGIVLVAVGYLESPAEYLTNQKLWAKFSVVVVLSLNGIFLHFYSFPKVVGSTAILQLPAGQQKWVGASGALSTVSWLFACYLGIARTWNYSVDYSNIMLLYFGLVLCALIGAHQLMRLARSASTADLPISDPADRKII